MSFARQLYVIGCQLCDRVANLAGNPLAILVVALFCAVWFLVGGEESVNNLTLILSVLAITLTRIVLIQQRRSEAAVHLKIDELIIAQDGRS